MLTRRRLLLQLIDWLWRLRLILQLCCFTFCCFLVFIFILTHFHVFNYSCHNVSMPYWIKRLFTYLLTYWTLDYWPRTSMKRCVRLGSPWIKRSSQWQRRLGEVVIFTMLLTGSVLTCQMASIVSISRLYQRSTIPTVACMVQYRLSVAYILNCNCTATLKSLIKLAVLCRFG